MVPEQHNIPTGRTHDHRLVNMVKYKSSSCKHDNYHDYDVDDRINQWLAELEDLDMYHETRSELGKPSRVCNKVKFDVVNSRRALRDERRNEEVEVNTDQWRQKDQRRLATTNPSRGRTQKENMPAHRQRATKSRATDKQYEGEQTCVDWGQECGSDLGESVWSSSRRKEKLCSGFLDKPRSQVLIKLMWPHMNQDPRYVTHSLTFNQLNFAQLVGGECRTILRCDSDAELCGRL